MVPLTSGEFEDNLREFFWAERTSADDVRRLYEYFAEFAADRARVDGQEASLFEIENTEPVSGTRWWELRQQGADRVRHPITWQDRANMLLTTDPLAGDRPPARLYCPTSIVGSWQIEGGGRWQLGADETFSSPGHAASTWCVHLARTNELWLLRRGVIRPERHEIVSQSNDRLELRPAAASTVVRLARVSEGR